MTYAGQYGAAFIVAAAIFGIALLCAVATVIAWAWSLRKPDDAHIKRPASATPPNPGDPRHTRLCLREQRAWEDIVCGYPESAPEPRKEQP